MFSARRPPQQDTPSKRSNGALFVDAAGASVYDFAASKRPRLELWGDVVPTRTTAATATPLSHPHQQRLDAALDRSDNVMVHTPECVVARVRGVPPVVADEIRRDRPSARHVFNCRVAVPVTATSLAAAAPFSMRNERHVVSYYVIALRQRLVLWQEGSGNVVALALPDEISPDEPLQPFLFALYGARVSLMVVSRSGRVLFWEDIELPYESVPLSVQIPLQHNEQVFTNAHASLTVASSPSSSELALALASESPLDQELKSILCWSSLGRVWEIAMEDRRIRVRSLERQQGGFLSGLTKTVSQFFFAASEGSAEIDPHEPIKAVKIVPSTSGDVDDDARVDKLLLFANGAIERRSFNSIDALDCNSTTVWHFDANRAAIAYYSERFPGSHLAKVFMVSIPYITDASTFGLLVAYVCTSPSEESPRVKYALFQFKLSASSRSRVPEPEWACFLDYEPVFSEEMDSDEYFDVETVPINGSAFYLVWVQSQPIHFAAIQMPAPGQTTVRSSGFSLQGVERNAALGFAPRVEVSAESSDAVKGSVSFILMDFESSNMGGTVCAATASTMVRVYNKAALIREVSRRKKRVEDADQLTPESHALGENLSVQEYAALLLTYFQEGNGSSGGSPLRIASRDVSNVAQAAVGVAFQILDAKASSGLRWGNDLNEHGQESGKSANAAIVTPKLVRFQLEEKRSRFEDFVAFVQQKCCDVWQFIVSSQDLMQYLVDGEEKLHAAVALCKFQGSISALGEEGSDGVVKPKLDGQLLLRAIERTVHQRGYDREQLRLAGYNSFDIFYCEVSKISEVFVGLSVEIQKVASESGEGNSEYLYSLLESGYSMQSLLKTPTATRLGSTGNWMFTRPIRESIADQISRLSAAVGYPAAPSSKPLAATAEEVFEIADQTLKLGGLLLDAYHRFIPTASGEAADDLRKEADITKRLTLNPLVFIATDYEASLEFSPLADEGSSAWTAQKKSELFKACIKLSEEYSYYEAMIFLTYREDEENLAKLDYVLGRQEKSSAAKRLESYCRKIPEFSTFLYRWYGGEATRYPWGFDGESARAQMFSYLLANASLFGQSLHAYLKTHSLLSKYSWVTAIASEKFDLVAQLTLREAVNEPISLPKRKTMASIAKIAALASPDTSQITGYDIKRELNVTRIHEVLMELPLDVAIDAHPLGPEELVGKSIDALRLIAPEDPLRATVFLIAVEALECLPEDIPPPDFDTYCVRTWRQCILADSDLWNQLVEEHASGVNDQKAEAMMRSTLLFKAMERHSARWEGSQRARSGGLTVHFIDDMVAREVGDSLIDARSRHLFVKTLHLAQSA